MYHYKRIESPIGKMLLIANDEGLCYAEFEDDPVTDTKLNLIIRKKNLKFSEASNKIIEDASTQLQDYFRKNLTTFNIPLVPEGTEFQKSVWQSLQEIPFGKLKTYKIQSENLKTPDAIRAIAGANGKNPIAIIIPCHRVIGSDGTLTGYAGGLWRKQWLLEHEGALQFKQTALF